MINKPGAIVIEGHVQGLSNTRSLGEAGIPVIVVDKVQCIARYSKYCSKFFLCPDFILDAFAEFLMNLAKNQNLHGWVLIPSNDHAVHTIARFKTSLEKFYKVITPDIETVSKIYDKSKLLEVAQNSNTTYPVTQYFKTSNDEINPEMSFPVLIKGRKGLTFYKTFGKKAFRADDEKELVRVLTNINEKIDLEETFTQELIPNDGTNKTISFTAFCINGEIKSFWMGVKLREHPIQYGTATFAESVYEELCYNQSVSLLKSLNYTGVCEVEYLKDPRNGIYKLIEINARTWLWVGLAKHCGIDYAKMIYNYCNQINYEYPTHYTKNIKWINWYTDFPIALYSILQGKLSIKNYILSLRGETARAIYNINDFKPTFAFLMLLVSFYWKRT
jgi:predicted ATP-grasp superfamily ATP-dependent carboligase